MNIPDLDFFHPKSRIKKAPDPGSGSATLENPRPFLENLPRHIFFGPMNFGRFGNSACGLI